MTTPYYKLLTGLPKTWTSRTGGLQNAEIFILTAKDSAELLSYSAKLKGKIIILPPQDTLKPTNIADASRYAYSQLQNGKFSTGKAGYRPPPV